MSDILWEIEHWFISGDPGADEDGEWLDCAYCGMSEEHEIHWSTPEWFVALIAAADDMASAIERRYDTGPLADAARRYRDLRASRGEGPA